MGKYQALTFDIISMSHTSIMAYITITVIVVLFSVRKSMSLQLFTLFHVSENYVMFVKLTISPFQCVLCAP